MWSDLTSFQQTLTVVSSQTPVTWPFLSRLPPGSAKARDFFPTFCLASRVAKSPENTETVYAFLGRRPDFPNANRVPYNTPMFLQECPARECESRDSPSPIEENQLESLKAEGERVSWCAWCHRVWRIRDGYEPEHIGYRESWQEKIIVYPKSQPISLKRRYIKKEKNQLSKGHRQNRRLL